MSINSFLDTTGSGSGFDPAAADSWLAGKTTLNLSSTVDHRYTTDSQLSFLINLSGQVLTANSSNTLLNKTISASGNTLSGVALLSGNNIFSGDITCQNFTANGSSTFINTNSLNVTDPLVAIGVGNSGTDVVDLGQYGVYNNGSGIRFTSLFRDHTDTDSSGGKRWKLMHNMTNLPSSTVIDKTNGVFSTLTLGNLETINLSISGGSVTSTAAELNYNHGITLGTASTSRVMTTDSNNNHTNTTGIIKATRFQSSNDLRIGGSLPEQVFDGSVLQNFSLQQSSNFGGGAESLTQLLAVSVSGMITASNTPYTISHDTNADSQNLSLVLTGATQSQIYLSSNGVGTYGINIAANAAKTALYGASGLDLLTGGAGANITLMNATQMSGLGAYSTTGVLNGTVTNGVLNNMTSKTSIIELNTVSQTLTNVPYTGTLLPYQQVIVYNKSSSLVTVGGDTNTSGGVISGAYSYRLHPKKSLRLMYDSSLSNFTCEDFLSDIQGWKSHKWTNDEMLNVFLNNNYTYISKVKFNNISGWNVINNVSGWSNVNASNYTFTNGSFSGATWANLTYVGYALTSTESMKFQNGVQSTFAGTLNFTGLTRNYYYELVFYFLDADGAGVYREWYIKDNTTGVTTTMDTQLYTSGGINSPGTIFSYIFRDTTLTGLNSPGYTFVFGINSSTIAYGMTLRQIGATL